jgi:predicted PurR-regulated permease PerM
MRTAPPSGPPTDSNSEVGTGVGDEAGAGVGSARDGEVSRQSDDVTPSGTAGRGGRPGEAIDSARADPSVTGRASGSGGTPSAAGSSAGNRSGVGAPLFGLPGPPISRNHPFVIGFFGATGVLAAWYLLGLLGRLSSVLTLVVIALFLALALDPLVRGLQARGLRRGSAVGVVFLGVIGLLVGFGFAVVPPLVREATELSTQLPDWVAEFQDTAWVQRLDDRFQILATVTDQLEARLRSGETVLQLFGGVLGAGQAVISGAFSAFTVLVLTLYFTASLNTLREAVYELVPASRRQRVRLLGDEIIRRIGGYTAGQISVASINALFTYLLLRILDLPYALVLAITVGILGLVPLVGAIFGAVVVTVVALFVSWKFAIIVIVYYLIYQQVENYVIAPRIMSRTVQVPGFVAVIAALAGGTLLGVLGALIAIPIAAGVLLIIQQVLIPRQERT